MKFKTVVVWWLVNNEEHKQLREKDKKVNALMPLVEALFPGINYYSITGFHTVMRELVIPALKKQFLELMTTPAEEIVPNAMTEIAVVLPSNGYEWQDSPEWKSKFQETLAAA